MSGREYRLYGKDGLIKGQKLNRKGESEINMLQLLYFMKLIVYT